MLETECWAFNPCLLAGDPLGANVCLPKPWFLIGKVGITIVGTSKVVEIQGGKKRGKLSRTHAKCSEMLSRFS